MPRTLMLTNAPVGRPYASASAALNSYLKDYLVGAGHEVVASTFRPASAEQAHVPLWSLETLDRLRGSEDVDLAVYCDLTVWAEPLQLVRPRRTVVFFHGLMGAPLTWLQRSYTILIGNSKWTTDGLRTFGGLPLWSEHRLLSSSVLRSARHAACPLPALEGSEGNPDVLGPETWRQLESPDTVVAVDFSGEADDIVHCKLMIALNAVARQNGDHRHFRLVTSQQKLRLIRDSASAPRAAKKLFETLNTLGMTVDDLYIGLGTHAIPQAALFRIMSIAKLTLAFNRVPESFGLISIESVMHGCPVFSNGCGNIRHLLPSEHGLFLEDTEALADGSPAELVRVAQLIYDATVGRDRDATAVQVKRGVEYIRRRYSRAVFNESLTAILGAGLAPEPKLEELWLALSPFVRRWNAESGRVLSDLGPCTLNKEESAGLQILLGRSAAELFRGAAWEQELVSRLWRKGILTWDQAIADSMITAQP